MEEKSQAMYLTAACGGACALSTATACAYSVRSTLSRALRSRALTKLNAT